MSITVLPASPHRCGRTIGVSRGILGRRIFRVLDMKSTDPIIELRRQARESSAWHSTQRVDLVRSQLNSELETGASRVPKEVSPETGVRQQATERPFHVSLTHASFQTQGLRQVLPRSRRRVGVTSHVNV
jgi:hypothetical protein